METIKQEIGKEYNPFKTEDKHYFGGFFNLADNNIKEAFNEVSIRLSQKGASPKTLIEKYTKENVSLVDYERFVILLSDYFPIIKEIDQINKDEKDNKGILIPKTKNDRIKDFEVILVSMIDAIENLRNYYTHFYHESIEIDNKMFYFLDKVLFKTVLDTKRNYLKEDKTKEMIKNTLKEDFNKIFNLKVDEYLTKDNLTSKKIKKARKYGNSFDIGLTKEITASIYNDAIKYFTYDKNEKSILSDSRKTAFNERDYFYRDKNFDLPISSSGIIFLLSCFLNRKEIEDLKSNIKGYKGKVTKNEEPTLEKNSIRFMTTHRIYSIWHYKGLKNKIKTSESATKETLLMQMIDEVSKVPNVVYQNLSKDLKDSFIEDWNEYYKHNEENTENTINSKVIHSIVRRRYKDKFNYFAIRFLDEFVNFPSLRFQVYLGNYLVDSRPKESANVITEREIKKKIFVFGKLNEVNQLKNDFFSKIEEDKLETNLEVFPNPSYHFPMENSEELKSANKIGIYLSDIENLLEPFKKHLNKNTSQEKISLIEDITQQNENIKIGQPLAYLSMNDIHSVIFEVLKNPIIKDGKIDGKSVEKKIKNQIYKQINEIKNKKEESKIIKNFRKKTESDLDLKKMIDDLIKEIKITDDKIKKLDENKKEYFDYQKNKTAKKRNYILQNSEKGEIATWLANDIKRFFPKEFKEKWKGYHHRELQLSIAYYDTQKQNVKLLLYGLDYRKEIPMLDFSKPNFLDFYEYYLKKRKPQLYNLLSDLEKLERGESINKEMLLSKYFKLFRKSNYQNKSLDDKINTALANPIFIERGFMDGNPTVIPNTTIKGNESRFANWFVAYKQFDEYQKFYNTEEYFLELKDKTPNEIKKIQSQIYTQKKNDWAIWKMISYIFKDIFNQDLQNVSLSELYQNREQRLENEKKSKEGERKQNFFWNKTVDLQLNNKINIPEVKLKDIGNFRKYEKDERIKVFLSYNDITDWMAYLPNDWQEKHTIKPINVIDIQIDKYEKIRQHHLLKEVQNLESEIYNKAINKEELLQEDIKGNKNPNFKKYIVNGLLKQIKGLNVENFKIPNSDKEFNALSEETLRSYTELEQKVTLLVLIRNKFAHNQLPNKDVYAFTQSIRKRQKNETYAEYYFNLFEKIRGEI